MQAVVESSNEILLRPATTSEWAQVVESTGEKVRVRFSASADGLLVVSEAFYPGWTVEVDGSRRSVLATNVAMRGVAVGAGDHEAVFRYRPASFLLGILITGATVALGAVWLSHSWLRKRKART
jgi:uncharacterized membrane protein YfhO